MIPSTADAQTGYTSVEYIIGFPSGDLGEYISSTSFRGAAISYQKAVKDNISAGIEVGWSTFYERKDYDTYTSEAASVTGIQYRYSSEVPVLVKAEYNFRPEETIQPFINLGIGAMYSRRDTDMGVWRLREETWHFAMKPEIGALYNISFNTSLRIGAKYYTGFSAGDLDTQSFFALSFGLAFLL